MKGHVPGCAATSHSRDGCATFFTKVIVEIAGICKRNVAQASRLCILRAALLVAIGSPAAVPSPISYRPPGAGRVGVAPVVNPGERRGEAVPAAQNLTRSALA